MRRYHMNESYFKSIDTPERAYLLGLIATDGCIRFRTLKIALKRIDRYHLVKIAAELGSNYRVLDYQATCKTRTHPYSILCCTSEELVNDLARHGITPRKTGAVQWWKGPEHLMPSYALGVLDGDGSLNCDKRDNTWRMEIAGNNMMINGFADFIFQRFVREPNARYPKGNSSMIVYTGLPLLHQILKCLYADCHLHLARKRARAEIILARQPRCIYHDWSELTGEELLVKYEEFGEWKKVAIKLGIPAGSISDLRKRKGIYKAIYKEKK